MKKEKEGGGRRRMVVTDGRESFPGSPSCWCWIFLDGKGKSLNEEDWLPLPAVTHKIYLSLPVSEAVKGRRHVDSE